MALRLVAAIGVVSGIAVAASACGGAPANYAQPSTTIAGAAADVDQAEAALGAAMGTGAESPSPLQQPGTPSPTTQPAEPAPVPPPTPTESAGAGADENHCRNVCEALGSMVRAVHHLCDLTGNDDDRCTAAKGRAESAEQRVSQSCPSCSP